MFDSFLDPLSRPVPGFPGALSSKGFKIPDGLPIGSYLLTFDGSFDSYDATFTSKLILPKPEKRRIGKLSNVEPRIRPNTIQPTAGGPGTILFVQANNLMDANSTGSPGLFLGHYALNDVVRLPDGVTVRGVVPDGIPLGFFDVVVTSSAGQPAVAVDGFQHVPPPDPRLIDPDYDSIEGGFGITITGHAFRDRMGITIDGVQIPVQILETAPESIRFVAPPHGRGFVTFGVIDLESTLRADVPSARFEYIGAPRCSKVAPGLVPTIGEETVVLFGKKFAADDRVFLETASNTGVYEHIQSTFDAARKVHQFTAPLRSRGTYRLYVEDADGNSSLPRTLPLTYFSFADVTSSTSLGSPAADTTALGDFDGDGDLDLFFARSGDPDASTPEAASLTHVLRNDGNSAFTDVTSGPNGVVPAPAGDDWRADRIRVVDVNLDGFPDLVLTTDARDVPAAGKSHTRILLNEARGGADAAHAAERVFRDRTVDLMPAARTAYQLYGGSEEVGDDWRALDLWIGDLERYNVGPPDIVITHDETKRELDVACGNYCNSGEGYTYGFYWGGSRRFIWNKSARGGLGRYRFDHNFFPRKFGARVPIFNPPPGVFIQVCNSEYGSTCAGTFTPFTGRRLAVADLDGDTKLDVVVLSNDPAGVFKNGVRISSLQVGMNVVDLETWSGLTDVTDLLTAMPGDFLGDALAIGRPELPDGSRFGAIAVAKANAPASGRAIRIVQFRLTNGIRGFEDVTDLAFPPPTAGDAFQASQIAFLDVDQDDDDDLVLLAKDPLADGTHALRILLNDRAQFSRSTFHRIPDAVFTPAGGDPLDGTTLAIGDVTGDGLLDFVVTRSAANGAAPHTRIVKTDK